MPAFRSRAAHCGTIKQKGAVRFARDDFQFCLARHRDGHLADDRNIKAHVLIGFGHLDQDCVLASEAAAAADAFVGSFKGLDGEHGASFDDHGLSDIEPADFLGDVKAEAHVIHITRSGPRSRNMARASNMGVEEGRSVQELQASLVRADSRLLQRVSRHCGASILQGGLTRERPDAD